MQIFISYKRENETFARLVRENLLSWGYDVWMDIFDIPRGSYWPDEIDKGLRASDVVVGILSPQAVESRNVKNEWDWAIVNGRRLILLMHEPTYVPMNYVSLNYINCVGTAQSNGIGQLHSALQFKPAAPAAPHDPFRDYLQKLYDRINRYLGQKILATLRTDEGMPEPLRLTGESTPEAVEGLFSRQPQIDPLFAIGGIEDDPTPPEKFTDFQQAFDTFKGRVLLLGEPGAGKTITLLHTARDAVVRRLQDPSQSLPILGIIPTWDADAKTPIADWLIASDPVLREGQLPAGDAIQQGRALLLLDGLDELGSERPVDPQKTDGDKFDPRQRFLDTLPANNQILVTCRRQDYAEIGSKAKLNGAITLQPLSESQIAAYLRGTLALWQAVQNDDGLREMAKTPLLLSFFAFAYQDHPEDAEQLTNLADSPGDLRDAIFERYVRERYEHEARKLQMRGQTPMFTLNKLYDLLGQIACRNILQWGDSEHLSQTVIPEEWFTAELGEHRGQKFLELTQKLNYLSKATASTASYQFVHLLLRDYFVYRRLLRWFDSNDITSFVDIMYVIGVLRDKRLVSLLIEGLQPYNNTIVRIGAVKALTKFDDEVTINPLTFALSDPEDRVRIEAIRKLGQIKDHEVVPLLIRLINDDTSPLVFEAAIDAVVSIADDRAVEPLIAVYYGPRMIREKELIVDAIQSLVNINTPCYVEVLKLITDALTSEWFEYYGLRRSAIRACIKIKSEIFVPYLLDLLDDVLYYSDSIGNRFFLESNCGLVVKALRAIGTPEALAAIEGVECPEDY